MKILIQHIRTQLFLKGLGIWTANAHEAFDFENSNKAIEFAEQNKMLGVQVLVKFLDSQYDEAVPIGPDRHRPRHHA